MDMEKYLGLWRLRSRSKVFVSVFSVLIVFLVIAFTMLPGITESRQSICGMEEHTHNSECYGAVKERVCIYSDAEETETTAEFFTDTETAVYTETVGHTEITTEVQTTKDTAEQQTTEPTSAEETTSATETAVHIHTDSCYIFGNKIICELTEHIHTDECYPDSEKVTEESETTEAVETTVAEQETTAEQIETESTDVADKELKDEEKELVEDVIKAIVELPTVDEFYAELDRLYEEDDMEGEEKYITRIQSLTVTAYCKYQDLNSLQDYVTNADKLNELREVFANMPKTYTTGTSNPIQFDFVNRGWDAVAPIVIYGGNAIEIIKSGDMPSRYWNGIVIEYDDDKQYYYVSEIYISEGKSGSDSKIRSLEAKTKKGFVLFVWSADSGADATAIAANQTILNVAKNDVVEVSVDPTTLSSGYDADGYGTVIFSQNHLNETDLTSSDPLWYTNSSEASDQQVVDGGGKITSPDGKIITTKTINGTSEENIFDITLTVQTQEDIELFLSEPDMAVVVVMDISNTMNYKIGTVKTIGNDTNSRYAAAVSAAEDFIDQFSGVTSGLSKLGFVAFNTHAHEIFDLSPCSSEEQASSLKTEMKNDTRSIIKASGYGSSNNRFTNVEGGLKMGYDMLKKATNQNKYIVFISDGFPTTYLKNEEDATNNTASYYEGYYTTRKSAAGSPGEDGVFYDYFWNGGRGAYCDGTSYSDKAARKARAMAETIKADGAKIFSIGIDVGTQTVQGYIDGYDTPIVDRDTLDYEIGSATDKTAFQNWLGSSIGSNSDGDELKYYFDSTAKDDIANAFETIFKEIQDINEQSTNTIWTTQDPMPVSEEEPKVVGFICFYDKDGNPIYTVDNSVTDTETGEPVHPENIIGTHTEGGENDAHHTDHTIFWDLKNSGYEKKVVDNTTYYLYKLKYKVRLVNEKVSLTDNPDENFVDSKEYDTNGETFLEYRNVTTVNGVSSFSDSKKVNFSIPVVKGYLVPLKFIKVNNFGSVLPGAEFSLIHDDENCKKCHGDETAVTDTKAHNENYYTHELHLHPVHVLGTYKAVSDSNGKVVFDEEIPSGHKYILKETAVPAGYLTSDSTYSVVAAYDTVTVTETKSGGTTLTWKGDGSDTVLNITHQVLPETGGIGENYLYIIGGLLIVLSTVFLICLYKLDRDRRRKCSRN